jgi:FHA domain-containing protein
MCATSLSQVPETPNNKSQSSEPESAATVVADPANQEEGRTVEQEGIVCPECNTANEIGWSFCQQCGKRLPKAESAPPKPSPNFKSPDALKTVPEQQQAIDPGLAPSLKTVAENPADERLKTVAEKSPTSEPEQPKPLPPTAEVKGPDVQQSETPAASKSEVPVDKPTVVVEAPTKPKSVAPPAEPAAVVSSLPPASSSSTELKTEHVASVSGVLCTQCGQSSSVGSTSCANCGAPITFGKTMVMSSQPAPTKGRLHLVMEGGQPGEIYDLSEDTLIGRSSGDITFPHDGFMSGRHARIIQRGGSFVLSDEGSRNGTFVKIKGEVELKPGDMVLVGKQLFRFEA